MRVTRAAFLLIGALAVATWVFPGSAAGAENDPIKIGFLTILSGSNAESGRDMLEGFQLYLEQVDYEMVGREVEFIVEDTGGVPANALSKARKLVEQDNVDVLVGPFLANEGYALSNYVEDQEIPWVIGVTSPDDLTQRDVNPYAVRMGWTSSQATHPLGEYVYEELGYRTIAVLGQDYAFGYETVGGFQKTFEEAGGKIVQKVWVPMGTTDYAPYITQLRRDVDAVFVSQVGADVVRFTQQWQAFGMKGTIPYIGGPLNGDESLLRAMGDEGDGIVSAHFWSAALDRPQAKAFVEAYRDRYDGDIPSYYSETNFSAAMWIEQALEDIDGRLEDRDAFMEALLNVELEDAPRGPIYLDEYHNAVQNIYIKRVTMHDDGNLWGDVIKTIPMVSQFWTESPEEYLSDPLYTRDFPPCTHCD